MAAAEMGTFGVSRWQLSKDLIISLASGEVDGCQSSDETDDYEFTVFPCVQSRACEFNACVAATSAS
jgi:hypothetical protein